jgi:hypothetical protein
MRGIDTIDSELGLLVAIRRMVSETEGRPPSTDYIEGCWTNGASGRELHNSRSDQPLHRRRLGRLSSSTHIDVLLDKRFADRAAPPAHRSAATG